MKRKPKTHPGGNISGRIPTPVRGAPLHDASTSVSLTITARDVKGAVSGDPTRCAAARALKRQLGVREAVVMRNTTYINYGTAADPNWSRYDTGEALAREIVAIDRGGEFAPGEYTIKPKPVSNRLGARPYKERTKPTGKRPNRAYHLTSNIREHF